MERASPLSPCYRNRTALTQDNWNHNRMLKLHLSQCSWNSLICQIIKHISKLNFWKQLSLFIIFGAVTEPFKRYVIMSFASTFQESDIETYNAVSYMNNFLFNLLMPDIAHSCWPTEFFVSMTTYVDIVDTIVSCTFIRFLHAIFVLMIII